MIAGRFPYAYPGHQPEFDPPLVQEDNYSWGTIYSRNYLSPSSYHQQSFMNIAKRPMKPIRLPPIHAPSVLETTCLEKRELTKDEIRSKKFKELEEQMRKGKMRTTFQNTVDQQIEELHKNSASEILKKRCWMNRPYPGWEELFK